MSLVFPQGLSLADAVARSPVVVVGEVLRLSREDRFVHVRVTRALRGPAAAEGRELEIRPAGHALGGQVAGALAAGLPAPSYALPRLNGQAPALRKGVGAVFLLQPPCSDGVHELSALEGWRPAAEADEIAALLPARA